MAAASCTYLTWRIVVMFIRRRRRFAPCSAGHWPTRLRLGKVQGHVTCSICPALRTLADGPPRLARESRSCTRIVRRT
ncbi:hypothetical protein KC367_g60 [Hortaea werneckii]|nr:hypothetical protein KC367_g60 [Hortaea werneckii]